MPSPDHGGSAATRKLFVMQPHYLPYCGFFSMLDQADVCVLLDTVPVSKQSWQTRNRIRARDGNTVWLSVPNHAEGGQPLCEVRIDNGKPWQRKHWRTIEQAYGHTPGWLPLLDHMGCVLLREWEGLADLTVALTASIAQGILGVDTPIWRASSLEPTRGDKAGRIIDLCHHVGADTYLTTTGATYLQDTSLEDISLEWCDYTPTPYPQHGMEWQPYLSIIDTIAHCHTDTLSVIRNTYDQACETRKQSENN